MGVTATENLNQPTRSYVHTEITESTAYDDICVPLLATPGCADRLMFQSEYRQLAACKSVGE